MKSLTILTFWILLILPSFSIAQELPENFPQLETVYKHLDEQMNFPCDRCYYELAKKMDGYYVVVVDYEDIKHDSVVYVKLWDAATKKFLPVNLKRYLNFQTFDENSGYGHEGIKQKQKECDFNYLYGYENYTTDLIQYLEGKSSLKPKELEMLARAYSTEATNFIHPNIMGVYITESKNFQTPDYEKVSPERVSSFVKLAEKSIGYYEQIKKIDPDYLPYIIEGIDLKINQDLMHYYLTLKFIKEPELAESFLNRVHFTENELAVSKAVLDVCEAGGIFIPGGDGDSYSLWYLQEKMNFRRDISIIHSILLFTPWYFDYIKQTAPGKFLLTLEEHKSLSEGGILLTESEEIPTSAQWLKKLRTSMAEMAGKSFSSNPVYHEAPNTFSLKVGNSLLTLNIKSTYLEVNDIAIIDLITMNPNSKIYVTHPNVFEKFEISGHFIWRGPIFEFVGSEDFDYADEKSIEILSANLSNPAIKYAPNSSQVDFWMFNSWGITLAHIHGNNPDNYKALYDLYRQKITVDELIKGNQQQVLSSYKAAVEETSSSDLEELLKLYTPTASKMLKDISELKTLTAKSLEDITFVFELYTPNARKESGEKTQLTATQKKILLEVNNKITRLLALKINEDLMWTRDGLENIRESLEFYDL